MRTFRTLVAIAEHGSFAAAARAVNLSQSAVSTQMRALEAELNVQLFDRSKRPPVLNEAGQALVAKARDLIAAYEDMQSAAASGDAVQGRLRLGAVGSTLTGVLPPVLTILRERYPNLHIEIVSGFTEELLQQVASRALDAAIVSDYETRRDDILWRPFLTEALVMIAPPNAAERDPKRLAQRYPFIRYSPTAAVGRVIERVLRQENLQVREAMRLDWLEAIEAMVHHGHGIAVVPERRIPSNALFKVKRVPLGRRPGRTLGLVEPDSSPKRRLTDALFDELTAIVGRQAQGRRQKTAPPSSPGRAKRESR